MATSQEGTETRGKAEMNSGTVEYTKGQIIRAEAVCLSNESGRLGELASSNPALAALAGPAARGAECMRADDDNNLTGINRNVEYYESLMEDLQRAKEKIRRRRGTEEVREARVILSRCQHHCLAIIGIMEKAIRMERVRT